jgi:hypothetical protein
VRRFTRRIAPPFSLDLHVLGAPPAFVLSQDQTLQFELKSPKGSFLLEGIIRPVSWVVVFVTLQISKNSHPKLQLLAKQNHAVKPYYFEPGKSSSPSNKGAG